MTRGTISQKIIARAAGREEVGVGEIVTVRVDLAMANDITAPLAIKQMEAAGAQRVFDPERICIVAGRHAPFRDIAFAEMVHDLGEWCRGQGIGSFYDNGEGMDHALVPELGLARPGMMICNADSHACTLGAFGAFAVAMGSTDMAYIFAFGETWLMVPPTIRVVYRGRVGPYVGSKDLILAALGRLGIDGARYKAVEFAGSAVSALSMDERFTLTNMAIEMGGKAGLIEPDDCTREYLASRTDQPYEAVDSDPDAALESVVEIDVDGMPPLVAKPHLPSNVAPVSEVGGYEGHAGNDRNLHERSPGRSRAGGGNSEGSQGRQGRASDGDARHRDRLSGGAQGRAYRNVHRFRRHREPAGLRALCRYPPGRCLQFRCRHDDA